MAMTDIPSPEFQTGQVTPTQVVHHWRAVTRTLIAMSVGFLPLIPEALAGLHLDSTATGAQAIVVAGAITRTLALPGVEEWCKRWLPWLSAQPPLSHYDDEG